MTRKHKPGISAIKLFELTLAKCDTTPASVADADELTLSPLVNVDRLSTGSLNDEGFIDLNEANVAGFCIAALVYQFAANQASKEMIAQAQPHFEQAADALAEIGARKIQRGNYIATGPELTAIRESLRLYREVILVSDKGLIVKGLIRAKELVAGKLHKVWLRGGRLK